MRVAGASLERLIREFRIPARAPDDVTIYVNKPVFIFNIRKEPMKTVDVGLFDVLLYARNPKLFEDLVSNYFAKLEEDIAFVLGAKLEDVAKDFTTSSGWSGRAFVIPRHMSVDLAKKALDFGISSGYIEVSEVKQQSRTSRHALQQKASPFRAG